MDMNYQVRNARPAEFATAGQLLVQVYSQLPGFPQEEEQPTYYQTLRCVGSVTAKPATELFVAVRASDEAVVGVVVFFGDMQYYGSGGTATQEKNAAGFRLLAVSPGARGAGVGKMLTLHCINRARALHLNQVVIHTTKAMETAWQMYERLGFRRSEDLDFVQGSLPVFGFRLKLL